MVEVVGRYGLDARSGHRHGGVGLEACHAEHRDQQRRLVLADAAAVGEVGAGVVQGVALALAHRDARITHVVGNPVCQHGDLAHRVVNAAYQLVNLGLRLGRRVKAAVVLVHAVEPERLVAPRVGRREHQLRRHIVEVDHVGLAVERTRILYREREYLPPVGKTYRRRAGALIEFVLYVFALRNGYRIVLYHCRFRYPEGYDVVELSAHGRDEAFVVRGHAVEQGVCEAVLLDRVFHDVAGLEGADLDHDLPRTPIYGTCGCGVIQRILDGDFVYGAVGAIYLHRGESSGRRERVIVIFQDAVCECTFGVADEHGAVDVEGSRSGLGDLDVRAVDKTYGGT